jgi:UDP-glucose 4-epimerase
MMFARVVVTGGAGFIGSHIADALVAAGSEVTVIDDLSGGSADNLPSAVRLLQRDVADPSVVRDILDVAPELVIHAAAQVSVPLSVEDPARDRRVNLEGTELVLRGAREAGSLRFVFVSSGGAIYGEAEGAIEEDMPRPANPYGIHKLAAEGYVRTSGLSYGIARYANVYGPRQRSDLEGGVVAVFTERLLAGQPITIHGTGEQSRDLVYVADVGDATLAIAAAPISGTWNVSTGEPVTVRSLLERLERVAGPAVDVQHTPPRAGDVSMSSLSNERVAEELGWRPRCSLDEGLSRTVAAYARRATPGSGQGREG